MDIEEGVKISTTKSSCLKTELQRLVAGYVCAFGVSLTAALIYVSGQLLSNNVAVFQTTTIRFTFHTLFMAAFLAINKENPRIPLTR